MNEILRRPADLVRRAAGARGVVGLMFLWLCVLALYHVLNDFYDADEIESVHTAWKSLNDGLIYRDFFQHHHPLLYWLLVPVVAAGGEALETLYASEALAFALLAGTVWFAYRTSLRLHDRPTALVAAILLLAFPFFVIKGSEIRPDALQVFLLAASFHFLIIWEQDRGRRDLVASAVLLALSFLALQKSVFAVALFGLVHLYWWARGSMSWREFLLFWAAFLVAAGLTLGPLVLATGLRNYLEQNWLLNMEMGHPFSAWRYGKNLWPFLLLALAAPFAGRDRRHGAALFIGLGLVASLFLAVRPFPQWLVPAAPFLAVAAAPTITRLLPATAGRIALAAVVVLASSSFNTNVLASRGMKPGGGREAQLQVYQRVLDATGPEDVVLNFHSEINLFRHDADWFWTCPHCLAAYRRVRPYDLDFTRIIRETEPVLIHTVPGPAGTPVIEEHIERSGAARRYVREIVAGSWVLYLRRRDR